MFDRRVQRLGATCLLALGMLLSLAAAETAPDASALLRAGAYPQLEQHYAAVQRQFATGKISGDELRNAFRAFYPTDPDLSAQLDEWVAAYPTSYVALLARGIYWKRRGWDERGGNYMADTSPLQIGHMDDAMTKALKDLGASIDREPKPFLSYFHILDTGRQYLSGVQLRTVYDKAAALDPNSLGLHIKLMMSLAPKWGGSAGAMRNFFEESKKSKLSAADLDLLESLAYGGAGFEFRRAGNTTAAEAAYFKAWKLGPDDTCECIANELNHLLYDTRQYDADIAFLTEYLQRKPGSLWALANRGAAEYQSGRPQNAIRDWLIPAEAGDSYSQNLLGRLYLTGYGELIQPDYPSSVHWLRQAAAQGEAEALQNLPQAEKLAAQRGTLSDQAVP